MQNQSNLLITFDTQMKTALFQKVARKTGTQATATVDRLFIDIRYRTFHEGTPRSGYGIGGVDLWNLLIFG